MHDFARNSSHHKRQQQQKKKSKTAAPKWLFLIALLLLLGLGFALHKLTSVKPTANITTDTTAETAPPTTTSTPAASEQEMQPFKDDYDFYNMLPASEVTVPSVNNSANRNTEGAITKYSYLLQAGSFRSSADADKLRAKLLLQGLDVETNKITNANGSIWHRVMVGPFNSRSKLNKAQDILAAANTDSLVVKVKQ
jgi:cell division protein FtsN